MRITIATALAALSIVAAGAESRAGTLAAADNAILSSFDTSQNGAWLLDGKNASLSFRTSKANEQVELSLSGFCGERQAAADGSGGATSYGYAQMFFLVDGVNVTETGNANSLCTWGTAPLYVGVILGSGVVTRQHVTVATPGVHTIGVLMQIAPPQNGSNLAVELGQTHVEVTN